MKDTLKVGDFLYFGYGATMRGYRFYQVVKIEKSKVYLTSPVVDSTGNQEGEIWVSGLSQSDVVVQKAKFIKGKLKMCDEDFKVKDSYWNTLKGCEVNQKFYYYSPLNRIIFILILE